MRFSVSSLIRLVLDYVYFLYFCQQMCPEYDRLTRNAFVISAETFKINMVLIIQAFSLVLFIPLSCVIWCRVSNFRFKKT